MTSKELIIKAIEKEYTIDGKAVHTAFVFFVSPLTHMVESRKGYFEEWFEAKYFADHLNDTYSKMDNGNTPYVLYIDGKIETEHDICSVLDAKPFSEK